MKGFLRRAVAVLPRYSRAVLAPVLLFTVWLNLGIDSTRTILGGLRDWWMRDPYGNTWMLVALWLLTAIVRRLWRTSSAVRFERFRPAADVPAMAMLLREPAPEQVARTARHEAAHVVVMLAAGGVVDQVSVKPNSTSAGRMSFSDWPEGTRMADALWSTLLCTLAGNLVDLDDGHLDLGATDDWMKAWALATQLCSVGVPPDGAPTGMPMHSGPGPIIEIASAEAARLISTNTGWIGRVAAALLEHTTLTGDQIVSLRAEEDVHA